MQKRVTIMNAHSSSGLMQLDEGQLVKIRHGIKRTIRCCSGTVWITQEAELRDRVLKAGESFTLDRPGLALVSAFTDALIAVIADPADLGCREHADRTLPFLPDAARSGDHPASCGALPRHDQSRTYRRLP